MRWIGENIDVFSLDVVEDYDEISDRLKLFDCIWNTQTSFQEILDVFQTIFVLHIDHGKVDMSLDDF